MPRTASRLLVIVALAFTLAGCDKCGDLFGISKPQSCRTTPAPQQ